MNLEQLKPNVIACGPVFPEPVKIIAVVPMGISAKVIAQGLDSGKVHQPVLSPEQIATLEVSPESKPYDGDSERLASGHLRCKSMAGYRPGDHIRFLGFPHRGCKRQFDAQPLGLVIVDEAHKMSAYGEEKKTLAYQLGEALSRMTDHYLLMTATPHKGDPKNFSLFLRLLDPDVYADVKSLHLAMERNEAPFYLRRVKEALVTFPDQKTGKSKSLFTKRIVHTAGFEIDDAELDFYDALTQYVEDQSIRASEQNTAAAGAVGFTMAMLQRRFASSIYAVRRTLEGLAKRSLNLSAIIGKSEEAKERRLVPEVIEGFFLDAAPLAGVSAKARQQNRHVYRIGRLPRNLMPLANELEPKFGRLGREYKYIVFDKEELQEDPTLEWVTLGHPLFECIRVFIERDVRECHSRGAVFYDLHASNPAHLDVFSAEVRDGRANVLHKRLFVVQTEVNGRMMVKQPTIFLDLSLAPKGTEIPAGLISPDATALEIALHEQALQPLLKAEIGRREQETRRISVEAVIAHEEARGWKVQRVESENRGFDLISRRPHPEDPQTSVEVRFIEVKGRSHIGEVALTTNEFQTAERLQGDFWLYVVFNCATNPELHIVRNPARLGWKPIVRIEHYHVGPQDILRGAEG